MRVTLGASGKMGVLIIIFIKMLLHKNPRTELEMKTFMRVRAAGTLLRLLGALS